MKGYHHLTRQQRYIVQDLLEIGKKKAFIARELGVHRSTVTREVCRNGNVHGTYFAKGAQAAARGRVPDSCCYKRKISGIYEEMVIEKMNEGWSPQQVSARLKMEKMLHVSHETVYRYIYLDKRGGGQLYRCLRHWNRRRKRGGKQNRLWKKIENRKFIDVRPEIANSREEQGHWERDLVLGKQGSGGLLTIVDRKTRFTLIEKVESRESDEVGQKTFSAFHSKGPYPLHTITNDNGCEFSDFIDLESRLAVPIFFTHPYCSWERGTNENTNGLLRQFFPKGCDFTNVTEEMVQYAQSLINSRPRRTLGYRTPEEIQFAVQTDLFKTNIFYEKKIEEDLASLTKNHFVAFSP
jgi:IS30 family transposase